MDHIRQIEDLLSSIDKISDPQQRAERIQSLFVSEWRPEYIAGGIALGRYAREDSKLQDFLLLHLPRNNHRADEVNIHRARHALIALPGFCAQSPDGSQPAGSEQCECRHYLRWICFEEAIRSGIEQKKNFQSIQTVYPDEAARLLQISLDQVQKSIDKNHKALEAQKKNQKAVRHINERIRGLQQQRDRIEDLQKGGDALLSEIPESKDMSFFSQACIGSEYPYLEHILPLNLSEPNWFLASLSAGMAEFCSSSQDVLDYAGGMLLQAKMLIQARSLNEEKIRDILLNVPWMLYRYFQGRTKEPQEIRQNLKTVLEQLEGFVQALQTPNLDAGLFLVELAELRCLLKNNFQQVPQYKDIVAESADSLCSLLKLEDTTEKSIQELLQAVCMGDSLKIRELHRRLLMCLLGRFRMDQDWSLLPVEAQKNSMTLLSWLTLCLPKGAPEQKESLRTERLLDRLIPVFGHMAKQDEDRLQFLLRMVRELLMAMIREPRRKQSLEERKALLTTIWVSLYPLFQEWGFHRTIPKDLGIVLVSLLQAAEEIDHIQAAEESDYNGCFLAEMAVLVEYAHIDLTIYESAQDYVDSSAVGIYLQQMTEVERQLLDPKGDRVKAAQSYGRGLEQLGHEDSYRFPDLLDFLSLNPKVGVQPWKTDYSDGLGSSNKEKLKKLLTFRAFAELFQKAGFSLFLREKSQKTSLEQELKEFKEHQKFAVEEKLAEVDRLFVDINRLVQQVRYCSFKEIESRHEALRNLLETLSRYKTWCWNTLPALMRQLVVSHAEGLARDVDQHREVNALILNAVAQRDTQQLTVAEEHVAGRKDWGSSENGEASFVRRYHNMILEARVELALSTRDENQAESAAKTMLSRLAKGEMQKKDHVSTNANQEMESKVSGWMYSRYMLKELAEVKHEAAKSMKDRINAWGWSLYRSLLRLPLVFLFCALPYLVFGGITLGQSRLSFQVPDWLPGIVFAVYLGLAGLIVLAAVLGVIWFLVFKPGSNDSRTVSGDINPLSMMIPKLLGLLFVTASTLMITDEGWSLVSQAKIPILLMMVLFFASMLFVFIRQVLLQNQQIDQSVKNRRSINILSLILMESYCIALFFSSIWGSILFETCEDDPCHWPSFLPVRLDLQMGDWVPYVHPGPILMWTVQIAFIGIVLNLFLTREKLVDET